MWLMEIKGDRRKGFRFMHGMGFDWAEYHVAHSSQSRHIDILHADADEMV